MESFGFKSSDKVAIILSSESEGKFLNDKAINAARWCKVKYFSDPDEAETWLVTEKSLEETPEDSKK